MRNWILGAAVLALATACGASPDANKAFDAMKIGDGKSGIITWAGRGGSGDTVTLNDAVVGGELKAKKMSFGGLHMVGDKPAFKDVVLNDVTTATAMPGVDFTVGAIELKNLPEPVGLFLATSIANGPQGEAPPFEAWSFDTAAIKNVSIKIDAAKASGGSASGTVDIKLAETSVSKLKDTVFGEGVFKGLAGNIDLPAQPQMGLAQPIKGTFDFGELKVNNLRSKTFVALLGPMMDGAMGGMTEIDPAVFENVAKTMTSPIDPSYDSSSWSGMNLDVAGLKIKSTAWSSKVDRDGQGVATKVSTPRGSIKLEVDPAAGFLGSLIGQGLSMVDMKSVEIYASDESTFDPATDVTNVISANYGVTDALDFKMNGKLTGVKAVMAPLLRGYVMGPDALADPNYLTAENFGPLGVIDLNMELADKKLIERVVKLMGPDAATMRADWANQVKAAAESLAAGGLHPTIANELTTAVSNFIANGGTLKISFKPPTPVTVGAVGDPKLLDKTKLGFTATTTP